MAKHAEEEPVIHDDREIEARRVACLYLTFDHLYSGGHARDLTLADRERIADARYPLIRITGGY